MIASFDIEMIDLPKERILSQKRAVLELHETHVLYHIVGSSEHPEDEDKLVWEESKFNQRVTNPRRNVSGVDLFWYDEGKCWQLHINFSGRAEHISISFSKLEKAMHIYDACVKYMTEYQYA